MPRKPAFLAVTLVLGSMFMAASAPSPLFVEYRDEWNFDIWLVTFAFAIYTLALLASLLVLGGLSDYLGRRPVILCSLVAQVLAMVLFLTATDIGMVLAARVIQGIAMGAVTGALSATLSELAPPNRPVLGSVFSSVTPMAGLALGSLLTALATLFAAQATVVVFGYLTFAFVAGVVLMVFLPDSLERRRGALRSMIPRLAVPKQAQPMFLSIVPILIATWMMSGYQLGLGTQVLRDSFGVFGGLVPGGSLAAVFTIGALGIVLTWKMQGARLAVIGVLSVAFGALALAVGVMSGAFALYVIGLVLAGFGLGGTFAACFRLTVPLVAPNERAGLYASIYVVSYLSFGVPSIIAGILIGLVDYRAVVFWYLAITIVSAVLGVALLTRRTRSAT